MRLVLNRIAAYLTVPINRTSNLKKDVKAT